MARGSEPAPPATWDVWRSTRGETRVVHSTGYCREEALAISEVLANEDETSVYWAAPR